MEPAAPPRRDGDPLIVAHRGVWGEAPQNSAAALEAAIAIGCDMVELDVRRTRDGRLVAVHDARVRGAAVSALDHDQLRARLGPGQAPRLEELLEIACGRMTLDIELKQNGYVEQVTATLDRHPTQDGYVITSFLGSVLAGVRRSAPQVRTGLLLRPGHVPGSLARRQRAAGADFLAPHAALVRSGLLSWAAERGLPCFVWTVNDTRVLRAMIADPRVAAVITDRPAGALALRSARPPAVLAGPPPA